ncbi:MAG: hypothetical protein R3E79_00625 [Caldilineaceae bacterium]
MTLGVTYTLRAWQRDAPDTEAVKEFADLAGEINSARFLEKHINKP